MVCCVDTDVKLTLHCSQRGRLSVCQKGQVPPASSFLCLCAYLDWVAAENGVGRSVLLLVYLSPARKLGT